MQAPRWTPPKTGLPFGALLLLAPFLIFVNLHASSWVIFGHGLPEDEDLVRIDGTLDLPDGVDPQDYLVVNAFDVAHPNSSGDFSIAVRASGMTVNGAVLLNDPHQSNPWVGVTTLNEPGDGGGKVVRISTKGDPQLVISPRSTAKAMIQVSPFAVTRDPQRAMLLASILEDLPELDLLEAVIGDVYMEQGDFASHPEIRQAHQALVEALDRGMPDLPPPLHVDDSFTSAPISKSGAHDKAQPLRVQFNSLDSTRQVEYRLVEHGSLAGVDVMMMEAVEFMPLDSVATMTRLDPADLYRYTDESGNTQRIRSTREALSLRNRPHRHPIFEGEQDRDGRQVAVIGAKSMFRWLNLGEVLGQVLSSGIEALLPDVTADALLKVDRDKTGIYVIRVHTGKMHDGIMDTVGEGSVVLEHHFDEVMFALTVNVSMALLDVIDILVGFRVDACNPLQAFLPALGTELARQAWSAAETNPIFVADTLTSLFSLFIPVMIDHYSDCLLQNPGTALLAFAKSVLTLEQVTRRISAVGSISDRVGALTGAPVGGVVGPLVTPMDTVIVVVGDPFTPAFSEVEYTDWEGNTVTESMSSLDAMDDPPGILPGSVLTLRGWRILDDGEEPRRFVLVDGYGNEAIAEIVNSAVIGPPDQNFPLQEVELQLPKELLGQLSVRVQGPTGPTRIQTPPVAEIGHPVLYPAPAPVFGHPRSGSTVP
ncbi:MAG: hypothetical protein JJU11_01530, partial [Candidatus Sumerlaeia bacterium]|nr:hypothetical protein [Candidatus Sumerlaeia bacterium]